MADHDRPRGQAADEPLQPVQAVQVEVVGRLVEQEHVVPGQQQGGQARPRRLPAGQRRHRRVQVDPQAQVGRDRVQPLVEVGPAQRQPPFQRLGVVLALGQVEALGQGVGRAVQLVVRRGHPGPAADEPAHRLARPPLRLLRQVADRGRRWVEADRAVLRHRQSGQQGQQGRLSGPVNSDQTDDVARRDDEVQSGEQRPLAVSGGEVTGDEGGRHTVDDPRSDREPVPERRRANVSYPYLRSRNLRWRNHIHVARCTPVVPGSWP